MMAHRIEKQLMRIHGMVRAGTPAGQGAPTDTLSMDSYLIDNHEATFLLKVKGDSMQGAGIMPGDMVLVERGREAKFGDIVIAEVDGAWTMKYFQKINGRICLMPANSSYSPVYLCEEPNISAVVTAVVRKY